MTEQSQDLSLDNLTTLESKNRLRLSLWAVAHPGHPGDLDLCPVLPQLLQMFYRQQEEIRRLRELLMQREVQTKQLELEIKNLRMGLGHF